MYWYIKYPLLVILVVATFGIGFTVWRSCVRSLPTAEPAPVVEPNNVPTTTQTGTTTAPSTAGTPGAVTQPVTPQPVVTPPQATPGVIPEVDEQLTRAQAQFDRGMLEAARRMCHLALQNPQVVEFDKNWRRITALINEINRRLMNSTAPCSEKKGYRVVRGDSLARIANRNYTSVGALLRINEGLRRDDGRDPIIRPSQTILYIGGVWSIRVSKQHFLLILYRNNEIYRVYTVGIGRDNRTPAGTFLITGILAEPAWTPPGKSIPFGDPENVLGTRWLRLTPTGTTDPTLQGYGIHGTWQPDSVGTSCSAGCVRMRNEEVEELFDFIPTPGGAAPPVRVVIEE